MTTVLAAAAAAVAWLVVRARPDLQSRLRTIQAVPTRTTAERVARRGGRRRALMMSALAAILGLVAGHVSPVVIATAAVGTLAAPALLRRRRRQQAALRAEEATVEAVFALAAELRAGQPPARALALVGTQATAIAAPLQVAAAAVASGAPAGDELHRVADEPGCAGFRGVAAAWQVTATTGGPIADVLDRLGEVLDAEQLARTSLDAAMAGARATMLLLAALPMFGVVLGQALGARPGHLLLHEPIGWGLLAVAVALDAVGVTWTRLIIRRSLR